MADFWTTVQSAIDEAPEAGYSQLQFGKLTFKPMRVTWKTDAENKRVPDKVELKPGQQLADGESLEFSIVVDTQELNENLQFAYERNIPVKKSKADRSALTNWSEIVQPSLEAVFGKDWVKKVTAKGFAPYVCVEDVADINKNGKKKTDDNGNEVFHIYRVPKFIAVYKNKEACVAARNERFPRAAASTSSGGTDEEGDEPTISEEVVEQAVSLYQSMKKNDTKVLTMLESKPFGDYDPKVLLELAKMKVEG